MGRDGGPGLHVRPALVAAAFVALVLSRLSGGPTDGGAQLAFVVLAAASLLNFLAAIVVVHRATVTISHSPSDAVVGDPSGVEVSITGMRSPLAVRMRSAPDAQWATLVPPEVGEVPGRAHFRGVATVADIEVCSYGPLGLLGYSRTRRHPLPRPLFIGPRAVAPSEPVDLEPRGGVVAAGADGAAGEGELTRSVREYVPGDPLRRVAWSVTARTGRLVTRELESPATQRVHIVVDLGEPADREAERVAAVAAWVGRQLLASGAQVRLVTMTAEGPTADTVNGVGLQRALAVAVGGSPPLPRNVPVLVINRAGVEWR